MPELLFWKYHGLGNDFIVVDRRPAGEALTADRVIALCDRHRGVGADGVLTLWADAEGAARMQIQNADGSDAIMCGNGLRCCARYLYDTGAVPVEQSTVQLRAGDRLHRCERIAQDRFRVEMGRARDEDPLLPTATLGTDQITLSAGDRSFTGTRLALGNPHLVIFLEGESVREIAERHGAALERHELFPERVNVSFVRPRGDRLEAVVHERGVGITQACGSAACAIGAAAVRRGLRSADLLIPVELPGGRLDIEVSEAGEIWMEGEAIRLFHGEVDL